MTISGRLVVMARTAAAAVVVTTARAGGRVLRVKDLRGSERGARDGVKSSDESREAPNRRARVAFVSRLVDDPNRRIHDVDAARHDGSHAHRRRSSSALVE